MNVSAPAPTVEIKYTVEPHPDPVVRALIAEIEKLRAENAELAARLQEKK
jgi:hypothetical protein